MRKLVSYHLFLILSLVFCFGLLHINSFAQNEKNATIISIGNSYLTDVKSIEYGVHGVEASAEFLLNDEKIGIRVPLTLYFEDDLYLGGGVNLKFYLNKGKYRAFLGPDFATGGRITNKYPEDFVEETRYLQLLADAGVTYHSNKLFVSFHLGLGREFKHKYFTANSGITIGLKL